MVFRFTKRRIAEGDIVSVDVGAYYNGFHGDTCATFPVGKVSDEAKALLEVTEQSLYEGIAAAQVGARLGDVSHAVEEYCASRGYGIVRNYCGHGIGRELHESPEVPELRKARTRSKISFRNDILHRTYDQC